MENNVILQQCIVSELAQVVTETVMERMGDILPVLKPREPEKYLTRTEVCKLLHISLKTLYTREARKEIIAYKIGGRKLYKASEIEQFLVKVNK